VTDFLLKIVYLIGNNTDAANTQVASLFDFCRENLDWNIFKYKLYNNYLNSIHSSSSIREMIKHHHSYQMRKT